MKFSLSWCGISWQLLLIIKICSFPWAKFTYIWQLAYVTFGRYYLTETRIFVQIEISLTNDFLFFSWTGCSFHLIFTGFIYLIHSFPKLKCIPVYTRFGWKQRIILGSILYFTLSYYIFISYIHHFPIDNFKVYFGFDHGNF